MDNKRLASYTVEDLMQILNISRTHAYEYVNNDPPFRILRIGKNIRIPKDSFDSWFSGSQNGGNCTDAKKTASCQGGC